MRTDCHDIQQCLGMLLAGELTTDEATRIEIHVSSCEACRRMKARFERMNGLLAAAPVPMPSRDMIQLMALRARSTSRRQVFAQRVFAAAAVIVTVLIPAATYFTFTPPAVSRQASLQPHVSQPVIDGFGGTFDMDF